MANAVRDAVAEKIELLDHLDGFTERRNFKFLWIGSAVLALVTTTCTFFLVRRRLNSSGK